MLLARTTCTVDDASCAVSPRVESLLDPYVLGAQYLCRQRCSLYNLLTPRACTRPVCVWCALRVPPMLQPVQSPNASRLYSARVLLARNTCAANATACAVLKHLGPSHEPGSPGRQYLCHQCCSFCNLKMPRAFTQPRFFWQALPVLPMLEFVW